MEATTDRFFPPKHQQPQDWERLNRYLAKRNHWLETDPPPQQFVGGFGNLNFLIRMDGERFVLRRPPLGPLPPGGNDMAREYKVTSRLWKRFPLAPRAMLLCEDVSVLGAPFLIMQYRPGMVIRMSLPDSLRSSTADLSKMAVEVLNEFQNVDPVQVGLDDLGRPTGFLQRARTGWIKRFKVAALDVYPQQSWPKSADAIMHWLEDQAIPPSESTLLHNDFKLNNIILDPSDPVKPIALLDWDMCTRGDPLFDFATLLSYWVEPDDPPALNTVGQMPTATATGWLNRRRIAEYYGAISQRDMSNLHYYRVLAAFKHCVIFMQIYARFCRGTTTDPRIADLGPALDELFDFTHEIVKGRVF